MSCDPRMDLIVKQVYMIIIIILTPYHSPHLQLSDLIKSITSSQWSAFQSWGSSRLYSCTHLLSDDFIQRMTATSQSLHRVTHSWGAEARKYASRMSPRIVTTQYGKLRGILITLPHRDLPVVEGFFGLPYASILGGELRFMPPTAPMEKWEEVRVAIDFKSVCPQRKPNIEELEASGTPRSRLEFFKRLIPFLENQHEECLNLNIYLPFRTKNDTGLLPVILFIHGESFDTGTGNAYDGSVMAAFGHVMVVTLNYRLGVLGFLSTDDSNALGNYATLDQVAALHWMKENIQTFGGNPNDVTIFGHSYGAVLTNILLISPVTRGKHLFKKAILFDGSVLASWAIAEDPLVFVKELSDKVNCSMFREETIRLVRCLKQKPWEELVSTMITSPKFFSSFGPTTDKKSVLPDDVRNLVMASSSTLTKPSLSSSSSPLLANVVSPFKSSDKPAISRPGDGMPVMMGCSRQVGHKYLLQTELDHGVHAQRMKQTLRTLIRNTYIYHRQKIYDIVAYHYGEWDKPRNMKVVGSSLSQLLGDTQIAAPIVKLARFRTKLHPSSETYFFAFGHNEQEDKHTHIQRQLLLPSFNKSNNYDSDKPYETGTIQQNYMTELSDTSFEDGDFMAYIFGAPMVDSLDPFPSTYSKNEKALSEILLKYWTNFAKTGDPNNGGNRMSRDPTSWPLYRQEEQEYISFVSKGSHGSFATVRHHYRGAKMGLWLDLIPKIHRSDNLERKFHLLDHYDNKSTFEDKGTKEVNWTDNIPRCNNSTPQIHIPEFFEQSDKISDGFEKSNKIDKKDQIKLSSLSPTKNGNDIKNHFLYSTRSLAAKSIIAINFSTMKHGLKSQGSKYNGDINNNPAISLSITVIVGCALLALNALIFICMCHQKRKTKQTLTQLEKRSVTCHNHSCICEGSNVISHVRDTGKKNSYSTTGGGSFRSIAMKSCSSKSTFDCLEETFSQISCNSSGSGLSDCKHNPKCCDNRVIKQQPPLSFHAPLSIQRFQPFAHHFHQHQGNSSCMYNQQQKIVQFVIPTCESEIYNSSLDSKKLNNFDQRNQPSPKYDVPSMHQIIQFDDPPSKNTSEYGSKFLILTTTDCRSNRKEQQRPPNPDPSTTV